MPPSKANSIQERLSKLSPDARKRVIQQIQDKRRATTSGIPKVSRNQRLPLSFAQQRLWFLEQMREMAPSKESDGVAVSDDDVSASPWNEFGAVEIEGQLDPDNLCRALNQIIERHEVLRTTFHDDNGKPYQFIHPPQAIDLPLIDLTANSEPASRLQEIIRQESRRWFDLQKWPLLRFVLVKTADDQHVLITTIHHIIYDQPSASILTKELMAAYQACEGESVELPGLSVQYGDFSSWERKRVEDGELDRQLDYWREKLHGTPQLIQLNCDYSRPSIPSGRGAIHYFDLPKDLPQQVQTLNRDCGTTEFMSLLAAFSAVLCRYTDQDDLVIGTTLSNRSVSELEGLIGLFVNVMPLRIDLSNQQSEHEESPSFRQLLDRVRTTSLELFKHQDLPFEMLVDSLGIERSSSHSPLFQVLFVYHNDVDHDLPETGIRFTPIPVDPNTAKYDLTLTVGRTRTGYTAAIDYNTDLFRPDTIAAFADCFRELVTGAVKAPDTPIRRLPLISSHEAERIDSFSGATSCDEIPEICLRSLLENHAQESPNSVAVQLDDDELTYQQLHARASQLAVLLREKGVSANQLVALCVERSIEMVVGALAIIKAGGAYVPIAPNDPPLRKAFILKDSSVSIVLTQEHLQDDFSNHPAEYILLDSIQWNQPDESVSTTPVANHAGDDLAYVIYTSGSTGQSKGVMITRHSLALHCQSIGEYYSLSKDDVCLQFGSFAFDPSVEEVFSALAAGAKIVLRGPDVWSPKQFVENVAKHRITFCQLPTSYWERLVSDLSGVVIDPSQLSSLKMMTVYGETMPAESVKAWRDSASFRHVGLMNSYGPTETTITATSYPISIDSDIGDRIPIGLPNGDRRMMVLDRLQQRVPVGVPGELYIGGPHVARGYLNRPDLTATKFLEGLAGSELPNSNSRFYRTGDLVCWRQDGNLEFLGRQDNQLKLRGFRIELGEVEAAISSHALVEDAAVVTTNENSALAAYVVWTPQQAEGSTPLPSEDDLRDHLRSLLPEYMIPATFSSLASMPQTPNGKLDRLSLPSVPSTPLGRRQYAPPSGPIETQLSKVWSDILQIDRIGRHDSFFDLGGHSLLATQLQASIGESLAVSLSLREIFSSPSLLEMAQVVQQHQKERDDKRKSLAAQIDQMSPEEVRRLLQEKRSQSTRTKSSPQ